MSLLFWYFWLVFIAEPYMYQWIELFPSSFCFWKNKISVGKYFFAFTEPKILNKKTQFLYIHKLNFHMQITSLTHTRFSMKNHFVYTSFSSKQIIFYAAFPLLTASCLIEFFHKNPWNALPMRVSSCFIASSKLPFFHITTLFSVFFGSTIYIYEHKIDAFTLIEYISTQ